MGKVRRLLHGLSGEPDFTRLFLLASLLVSGILLSVAGILFYLWAYQDACQLVLINIVMIISSALLLALLVHSRAVWLVSLLSATCHALYLCFASLYGIPDAMLPHMLWLALVPIFVVFQRSLLLVLLCTLLIGVLAFGLQAEMAGITRMEGWLAFYRLHPEKLMTVAVIFLFGFSGGGVFLLLLRVMESSHQRSIYDHLTGLRNRRMLDADSDLCFRDYLSKGSEYHIIFTDLDRFKEVNDLFGHDTGDQVLRMLGQRLRGLCADYGQIGLRMQAYRFGGDEFLFLVFSPVSPLVLRQLMQDITLVIEAPYQLKKYVVRVGVSLGLAQSNEHADSAVELVNFADIAMYASKQASKLNYPGDKPVDLHQQWQARFSIYKGLQRAVEKQEFHLAYQPVYCADAVRIKGCEALLRWNSSFAGDISPDEFIAVAEATGSLQAISRWVLGQAMADAALWVRQQPDFILSINISPYQLKDQDFINGLRQVLREDYAQYLPNIEFEITETAPITNSKPIALALQEIRNMGVRLSLDDYGQGSTSFLDLKAAAFHVIKLDKALLWDAAQHPANANVIRAAVQSAHSLGLEVTAEGVETLEHLQLARKIGCDCLQGYLFSHPVTAAGIDRLLGVSRPGASPHPPENQSATKPVPPLDLARPPTQNRSVAPDPVPRCL